MKLKEVTHEEKFCGELTKENFNIHSNRFVLFDKFGNRVNEYQVEKIPGYLELEVLETCKSGYNNLSYGVGFPTTHIKLNIADWNLLTRDKLKYGEVETE